MNKHDGSKEKNPGLQLFGLMLLVSTMMFMGCAPIYIPNPVHVPLHSKKGELNASAGAGVSGYDIQASYTLSDHFCIMSNASLYSAQSDDDKDHQFFEGGVGYFRNLGKSSGSGGRFECFGGIGWGKTDSDSYLRYFIQQNFGLTGEIFDGALSLRLAYVDFSETDINDNWFIEPVLTAKIGHKSVKFFAQAGLSFNINHELNTEDYEPIIFSIGISFDLGKYR